MRKLLSGSSGLWTCLILIVSGVSMAALSTGSRWATVEISEGGLPRQALDLQGADLLPAVAAGTWPALIAAVVALVVLPTAGRQIVGALVAVGCFFAISATARFGLDTASDLQSWLILEQRSADVLGISSTETWLVALVGWLLGIIGGMAAVAFSDTWPRLGSRYERGPSTRSGPVTSADTWKALDRGEDPTA